MASLSHVDSSWPCLRRDSAAVDLSMLPASVVTVVVVLLLLSWLLLRESSSSSLLWRLEILLRVAFFEHPARRTKWLKQFRMNFLFVFKDRIRWVNKWKIVRQREKTCFIARDFQAELSKVCAHSERRSLTDFRRARSARRNGAARVRYTRRWRFMIGRSQGDNLGGKYKTRFCT